MSDWIVFRFPIITQKVANDSGDDASVISGNSMHNTETKCKVSIFGIRKKVIHRDRNTYTAART